MEQEGGASVTSILIACRTLRSTNASASMFGMPNLRLALVSTGEWGAAAAHAGPLVADER
jgi:hypothetical protein